MSKLPLILLVEDEDQIVRVLRPTLQAENYETVVARTGAEAQAILRKQPVGAVILDLGLPDIDGKEVIAFARQISNAPILVLSARGDETEKIAALDLGAEDYVAKPFSVGELMARVRVMLRSTRTPANEQVARIGEMEFDFRRRRVRLPHGEIQLSGREAEFLRLLTARPGSVVTHRDIITAIWGDLASADAQFVRVLAGLVRQKIEDDPARPRWVLNVPGVGYQLGVTVEV